METEESNCTRNKKEIKKINSNNNSNKTRSPTLKGWNCRRIHLLTSHNPKIVCLQETFQKESNTINFK